MSLSVKHNPPPKQIRHCMQHSMVININKPPRGSNCNDDGAFLLLKETSIETTNKNITANVSVSEDSSFPDNESTRFDFWNLII